MANFRFDELMKDLGLPGGQGRDSAPTDEARGDSISAGRPDLAGSGLGEAVAPLPEADAAQILPDDALSELWTPKEATASSGDLSVIALDRGCITTEQLETARRMQPQSPGRTLCELLVDAGAEEAAIQQIVAELARIPFERLAPGSAADWDQASLQRLGSDFCRDRLVLPLRREGSRIVVGTTSPDDLFLLEDVKRRLGVAVLKHVLMTRTDILAAVEHHGETDIEEIDVEDLLANVEGDDVEVEEKDEEFTDFEAEAESSPVVKYVNHIIQTAVKEGASDIHIEPGEDTLKIRFRIDGVLFEMMTPPRKMHGALTSRIKIMSNLDIAERRLPQDGRICATVMGRRMDLRVSTVPTPRGEKTVMRILDTRSINVTLDDLGFAQDELTVWKNQISQPHGVILVTGPTGSGKTTTLYSSIRQMDRRRLNISTVEDPVEYHLDGITQIQTHDMIGMDFATALKSLLRQDPDVILVGEIRDLNTATTAIQASLTGHLVLSTLHTNDAPSSITRLINIGIEPFLVGAAVNSILAQRLVRSICPDCSAEQPVPTDMAEFLSAHGVRRQTLACGAGCSACRETGYAGRSGLYELLVLDDFLRDRIASSPNVTEFRRLCVERGMSTLRDDGFAKVQAGKTTVEEVLRVTEATI
ncbi:MAG: Flp pilus assembly complex ATPase component TadA [Phycisphaerales bacterium]|nr:Flp pilus assembly complex ATPase component TadA [Phycisphaerales bacterium]